MRKSAAQAVENPSCTWPRFGVRSRGGMQFGGQRQRLRQAVVDKNRIAILAADGRLNYYMKYN
jgi:hypothetical protein